ASSRRIGKDQFRGLVEAGHIFFGWFILGYHRQRTAIDVELQILKRTAARFDGSDFLESLGQPRGEEPHAGVKVNRPLSSAFADRTPHQSIDQESIHLEE